jgi:16S rRNA (uracil1498-N3)-methyltransferase
LRPSSVARSASAIDDARFPAVMTAHHFFADPQDVDDRVVTLRGAEAHHAAKSLRVRIGEEITVADGTGRVVDAVVRCLAGEVRADVVSLMTCAPPVPSLTLYQALTKSDKLDDVVEKASELGVHRIVPFVAERSVVRWDAKKRERARERWSLIARAAAKLSKSPWLTGIDAIADGIAPSEELVLVMHEGSQTRVRDVLPDAAPPSVGIVVGPEGGLSEDEVEELSASGHAVSLGPRVLRTETAGIVAVAVVAARYGTLG